MLTAKGIDINVQNKQGDTALRIAAERGCTNITELLNARAQEIHVAENIQNSELSNIDLGEERVTDLRFGWER